MILFFPLIGRMKCRLFQIGTGITRTLTLETDRESDINQLIKNIDHQKVSREMSQLMSRLFPICRSITGNGFRETLDIIKEYIPLTIHEVPSGTEVFDWVVPREWNIKDAYVKNSKGERIIDFQTSNLHVVGYSVPVHKKVTLPELKEHLHTLPDRPEWIPYRTSYYNETWGFCLSYKEFTALEEDTYEVYIDSSLEDGNLTYGEYLLKGKTSEEVLLSCHACHPSLCNDNVSGLTLIALLGKYLSTLNLKYSYRILIIPGTTGSITWLAMNEEIVSKVSHGLVVTCVGDPGATTYKRSRIGNADIDKAVEHVLKHSGDSYTVVDFSPYGYDERQYCSPGFNMPVGCLSRTPHGQYPEYHTSADNLDFVQPRYLIDSLLKYVSVFYVLENNKKYLNMNPKCEPQLGKRGLYENIGGDNEGKIRQLAILWVLNLSDGNNTLLDISDRSGLQFDVIKDAADKLHQHHLLKESAES